MAGHTGKKHKQGAPPLIMKPNKLKFNGVTFASKAEMEFAKHLTEIGIDWEYEPVKVPYVLPPRTYKPDFRVRGTDMYIEYKGFFDPEARLKMLCVKEQHPEMDICFAFMRGKNKISSNKKSLTYEEWALKHGFSVYPEVEDKHERTKKRV